jgi:hypothetical protein
MMYIWSAGSEVMTESWNRFVVQAHRQPGRPTHYDLMLERAGALVTWSFDSEPWAMTPATQTQPENGGDSRDEASAQWRLRRVESSADAEHATEEKTAVSRSMPCVRLPAHRLRYLDFEGDIGGGRGSVQIVDRGAYSCLEWNDRHIVVNFRGTMMRGEFELQRLEAGSGK